MARVEPLSNHNRQLNSTARCLPLLILSLFPSFFLSHLLFKTGFPNGIIPLDRLFSSSGLSFHGRGLASHHFAAEGEKLSVRPHRRPRAPTPGHPLRPPTPSIPNPSPRLTTNRGALSPWCLGIRVRCYVLGGRRYREIHHEDHFQVEATDPGRVGAADEGPPRLRRREPQTPRRQAG